MFREWHKPKERFPMHSKSVESGRNAEHVSLKDSRYVRCRQCGFVCHKDRDAALRGKAGTGVTSTALSPVNTDAMDPVVSSGCPLCGAYTYR
jgi:hypothetical protein